MNLRDYQVRAVQQIDAANSAIYCLPTGGGKTVIFASLIETLAARGERVLVIVHRHEILNQTSHKLTVEHGIIRAGLNADLSYPVQLASIQTLSRRTSTGRLEWPKADVVVMDECHSRQSPHLAHRTRSLSPCAALWLHCDPMPWRRARVGRPLR